MGDARPLTVIIPARMGSQRFPGKVLADQTGWPLIRHVWDRARQSRRAARIVIATDDQRIADAAAAFGAEALLTSPHHANGTMRIEEAARLLALADDEIVVNVQGDEPELEPELIDLAAGAMETTGAPMATVASPFRAMSHAARADLPAEDPADANIVKVVTTIPRDGVALALYFSRARIPHPRAEAPPPHKHIGLYAYRASFLREYVNLPPTPLEQAEMLEQLRVLEHGRQIAVALRRVETTGIDTPEQYHAFVARWRQQSSKRKAQSAKPEQSR